MSVLGNERLEKLQRNLGYHFQDPKHLELALTHRSIGHQPERNNERLEFLGDAVLQLSISSYLYNRFPRLPEGELAKIRSLLVRESTLAEVARDLELNHCLMVGK